MCVGGYTEPKAFAGRPLSPEAIFISIDPSITVIISETIIIRGIAGQRIEIKCYWCIGVKSAEFRRLILVKVGIASRFCVIEEFKFYRRLTKIACNKPYGR